jgi:polysaccharide biosynthesis/export protein ExoF
MISPKTGGKRFWLAACMFAATAMAAHAEYRLAPSDGIRIKVQDWSELSGEYTVNPDGKLLLPVVGTISVTGLSLEGLATAISNELKRVTTQAQPVVTAIEIIRFRPIFVLGDVQTPGEIDFRPGLSALQAVSKAGGYFRPPDLATLRTGRDIANALGDLQQQRHRLLKALAMAARLEAALEDGGDITFPAEVMERAGQPAILAIMRNENRILLAERQRAGEEKAMLAEITRLFETEITALEGQAKALEGEAKMLRKQLESLRSLTSRGLALTPNIITLERTIAQNQNERLSVSTTVARARQSIALAAERARTSTAERLRKNADALREARNDEIDARAAIRTADALLEEAQATSQLHGDDAASRIIEPRQLIIIRQNDGRTTEISATDATVLEPGDVLKVVPLPAAPGLADGPTGSTASTAGDVVLQSRPAGAPLQP